MDRSCFIVTFSTEPEAIIAQAGLGFMRLISGERQYTLRCNFIRSSVAHDIDQSEGCQSDDSEEEYKAHMRTLEARSRDPALHLGSC